MRHPRPGTFTGLKCALLAGLAALPLSAKPPNLLVIMTDEHNFRTLGCYRDTLAPEQAFVWGPAVVETPFIDRIARDGALCTSFYATSPVCSPARGSFMSGRYPQNTPVVTNNIPMDDAIVTFAEVLRRQGYATGYAGKWHLDGEPKPGWEPQRKFGFEDNRYMFNRGHWKLLEDPDDPKVGMKNGKPSYGPIGDEKTFTTDWLTDRTIEFIEAHRDAPFCYMLSYPDPHGPDTVRPPYDTMFAHQKYERPRTAGKPVDNLPGWARTGSDKYDQSQYYGMVKCIDDNIGRILKFLEDEGLLDDTIVVFTADHGDLRGEHHKHNKGVPFEGSAKVPFVIRWPAKIAAGTIVDPALDCTDFLPTIVSLMGFETPGTEEGRDASALLTGDTPEDWDDRVYLRAAGHSEKDWIAAVSDRYKLIITADDEPWLIDLEKDPDELVNAYGDPANREAVSALAAGLIAYGERSGDPRTRQPDIAGKLAAAAAE